MSQASFESRRDDARRSIEEQEVREALLYRTAPVVDDTDDEIDSPV